MKHDIVVVYNLRMYMKEDNPGQKKITDGIHCDLTDSSSLCHTSLI